MKATGDEVVFLDAGGILISLWDWKKLAEDSVVTDNPRPQTFRGMTLAWNCATLAEVDEVFAKAVAVGGKVLREPSKTDYGGYRGYFSDPDGHVWEVVQAPGFGFDSAGRLTAQD